jgi:ribonuclease P protein subunit POP4
MPSPAENNLPKVVDMIADRIGLNYDIKRKEAAEKYLADNKGCSLLSLKNSYYSLGEERTRKPNEKVTQIIRKVKNPLKLNANVRKQLYKLTPEEKQNIRYSDFEEINQLWSNYASTVLQNKDPISIFRMDLHGCLIKCTASKNPTLVGTEGFVVQDTKNTFLIVKKTNRLVTLPKRESIFEFSIREKRYRIHGCNFLFTVQARTKLKYKQRRTKSDV